MPHTHTEAVTGFLQCSLLIQQAHRKLPRRCFRTTLELLKGIESCICLRHTLHDASPRSRGKTPWTDVKANARRAGWCALHKDGQVGRACIKTKEEIWGGGRGGVKHAEMMQAVWHAGQPLTREQRYDELLLAQATTASLSSLFVRRMGTMLMLLLQKGLLFFMTWQPLPLLGATPVNPLNLTDEHICVQVEQVHWIHGFKGTNSALRPMLSIPLHQQYIAYKLIRSEAKFYLAERANLLRGWICSSELMVISPTTLLAISCWPINIKSIQR